MAALVSAPLVGGCGGSGGPLPSGRPVDVVRAAPARTERHASAQIFAAQQDAFLDATVDLRTGAAHGRLRAPGAPVKGLAVRLDYAAGYTGGSVGAGGPPALLGSGIRPGNPLVALDLVAGVVTARSLGGNDVRGVNTAHYETQIDPARAAERTADPGRRAALAAAFPPSTATIPAEVWVDGHGEVRRVQFGNDLTVRTTTTDERGLPVVTTIDFFDFGG